MYQVTGKQTSLRLSEEERKEFNSIAEKLQKHLNKEFTNSKGVVFALIAYVKGLELELESLNNKSESVDTEKDISDNEEVVVDTKADTEEVKQAIPDEIVAEKLQIIKQIGYTEPPTDQALFKDLLEIINNPISTKEVEVEKEVKVEVERKLNPHEYLMQLTPEQDDLLTKIARWRSYAKKDEKTDTVPNIMLRMIFNRGTLTNDHGQFETGLNTKKAKV